MRVRILASTSVAVALAVGSLAASSEPARADGKKESNTPVASQPFATLAAVKAAPMSPGELDKVKGLHIHFTTPGNNLTGPFGPEQEGWHFVNHIQNNLGKGNANDEAGPGYSGLCGAALRSPAITIPGQNPMTGAGGGC